MFVLREDSNQRIYDKFDDNLLWSAMSYIYSV